MNFDIGEVDAETVALSQLMERRYFPFVMDSSDLVIGKMNVIAAEVHQNGRMLTDSSFDLGLIAIEQSPAGYLDEILDGDAGRELVNQASALLPKSLRDQWMRDFRFIFHGELGEPETEFPEDLWLRRLGRSEFLGETQSLGTIEARLKALEGKSSPVDFRITKEWLFRKEAALVKLEHPPESDEIAEVQREIDARLPRDPALDPKLIDLSAYYNASFYDGRRWHAWSLRQGAPGRDQGINLASLPETFVPLHGVDFDLRGVIQLDWENPKQNAPPYPQKLEEILIEQKTSAVHFLMSCFDRKEGSSPKTGEEVARFVIHYRDGSIREEMVTAIFGKNLDTFYDPKDLEEGAFGWRGTNDFSIMTSVKIGLSELIWENPHPDKIISHLDFISSELAGVPFLVAITLE